ncbi:hypothetical protein CYMTET_46742 [Cymbomonas tetramitiformis]|uniref:PH domain-containing protein n=1 Tax=Cymbomonas tetramitiformis TaxID=36881 RepID=A0AAE0BX53_9CHLO|nr:hypothetical protein CYMTET_46742 [Cymbomonas tetramitiformis]
MVSPKFSAQGTSSGFISAESHEPQGKENASTEPLPAADDQNVTWSLDGSFWLNKRRKKFPRIWQRRCFILRSNQALGYCQLLYFKQTPSSGAQVQLHDSLGALDLLQLRRLANVKGGRDLAFELKALKFSNHNHSKGEEIVTLVLQATSADNRNRFISMAREVVLKCFLAANPFTDLWTPQEVSIWLLTVGVHVDDYWETLQHVPGHMLMNITPNSFDDWGLARIPLILQERILSEMSLSNASKHVFQAETNSPAYSHQGSLPVSVNTFQSEPNLPTAYSSQDSGVGSIRAIQSEPASPLVHSQQASMVHAEELRPSPSTLSGREMPASPQVSAQQYAIRSTSHKNSHRVDDKSQATRTSGEGDATVTDIAGGTASAVTPVLDSSAASMPCMVNGSEASQPRAIPDPMMQNVSSSPELSQVQKVILRTEKLQSLDPEKAQDALKSLHDRAKAAGSLTKELGNWQIMGGTLHAFANLTFRLAETVPMLGKVASAMHLLYNSAEQAKANIESCTKLVRLVHQAQDMILEAKDCLPSTNDILAQLCETVQSAAEFVQKFSKKGWILVCFLPFPKLLCPIFQV